MNLRALLILILLLVIGRPIRAQQIMAAGQPAQLEVRVAGERSIRVTLKPISFSKDLPLSPGVSDRPYPAPAIRLREFSKVVKRKVGALRVEIWPNPLRVIVKRAGGEPVQELVFENSGRLTFALDDHPILGLGEGGPKPESGKPWRQQPIQFDRRGRVDTMEPRWQSDAYGSRNPVAMLLGTGGWGIFVASPWVEVDLSHPARGAFNPRQISGAESAPQNQRNQGLNLGKGLPPRDQIIPGLYDVFVFDAQDPSKLLRDYATITGPAAMPPKWALGYMQSHRTLQDEAQMLNVVDTFRAKKLPIDAVIYLGTGFTPRGWNTLQPSFNFNPEVFRRDPKEVIADLHARNVKLILHMVPWDRDRLPTLQGSIPAKPGEPANASHIQNYWQEHVRLLETGVDAFWPDEGDWFNLNERLKRHQMYYEGSLATRPNIRPWSLHRNGYPGIAQWGGWVWSGDTESSWKTLEGQIAVGINYSLSIGPYWGSDIGGFYPNAELTGELYARWYQFASFCGSFRAHGRTWWTRLPWGWGLSDMGPRENGNSNASANTDDPRNILQSSLNNPAIEPAVKKYDELRYQLLPYTYTLTWEARDTGLPLMRAMWLHYPDDPKAAGLGTQYLWGRDLLVAPVFQKGALFREIYLPKGDWYDWWTNARMSGGRTVSRAVDLETMPLFVRAGAIIPFDPLRQYTSESVTEPTILRIYCGTDGDYTLYEDDGISQEYLKGTATWTHLQWSDRNRTLTISPGARTGAKNRMAARTFKVLLLPEGTSTEVRYLGGRQRVKL